MPIIQSLLDIDFYKFTMGRLVFKRYREVPVRYALQNRTSTVRLAEYVQEHDLRRELDHVRTLRFNNSELHYLRGTSGKAAKVKSRVVARKAKKKNSKPQKIAEAHAVDLSATAAEETTTAAAIEETTNE